MAKNILAIVGSYRKSHIVDSAVDEILSAAQSGGAHVEKIYLIDQHIEFCTNCRKCMQSPGPQRGRCIHNDDMAALMDKIDAADGLVLASPVNFYNVTAVTRKFMERLVGYAYWPWGQWSPKDRPKPMGKKAVLVTATAMPAILGRFSTGAIRALKSIALVVGAKPVAKIFIGMAAIEEHQKPSKATIQKARKAGLKLVA
jgi:multimeric flavodoxin WrbA